MTMKVSGKAADDRRGDRPNDGGDCADAFQRVKEKGGPAICADRAAKVGSAGGGSAAGEKVAGADLGEAVSAGSTPLGGPICTVFPSGQDGLWRCSRVGVETGAQLCRRAMIRPATRGGGHGNKAIVAAHRVSNRDCSRRRLRGDIRQLGPGAMVSRRPENPNAPDLGSSHRHDRTGPSDSGTGCKAGNASGAGRPGLVIAALLRCDVEWGGHAACSDWKLAMKERTRWAVSGQTRRPPVRRSRTNFQSLTACRPKVLWDMPVAAKNASISVRSA